MTSRDSWQQSKTYPTYSQHIVCSFRSEEHQFPQIYIRIIQKDSRNSWILTDSFWKTSNLTRNIGNENANVMCEGEGENSKCWKVMIDVEKKAWNITCCTFVTYLGNTLHYTVMKKFSTSWNFPWNCKIQVLRVNSSSQIKYWMII